MTLPRDILERVQRVAEFHQSCKLTEQAVAAAKPADPAQRPATLRAFDEFPKVPLPTTLLDAFVDTLALMHGGLEVLPDSQQNPPQNLKTLASWLHLAGGLVEKRQEGARTYWVRTVPSGGHMYPCEIYVAAFGIDGLEPGFYHFSPREFALHKLRDGWETLSLMKRGRPDLEFLKTAPAALLVSTVYCRSTWRFRRRGYPAALHDTGHLVQNLVTAGNGLGITNLVRLRMNDKSMGELIGVPEHPEFADAEAVQAMVVWAAAAEKPIVPPLPKDAKSPAGPPPPMPPIPRKRLAAEILPYGSILAAHADCVAPGVAVREIRPPLTELSPLTKDFPVEDLPVADPPEGGAPLRQTLLKPSKARDFRRHSISRGMLWNINRLAFRGGSFFPLFPGGQHVALVRPFWVILSVTGMEQGVWFYHAHKDLWSRMELGRHRLDVEYLSMESKPCHNAAAVCFMAANLNLLLHNGGPDLYRLAHIEAGICAQRMHLAAGGYHLIAMSMPEFYDDAVRAFLGMEKTGWEILYETAIGVPWDSPEPQPDEQEGEEVAESAPEEQSAGGWADAEREWRD